MAAVAEREQLTQRTQKWLEAAPLKKRRRRPALLPPVDGHRRIALTVGAMAAFVAIGAGGYMVGASEGADVDAAELAGTLAGTQRGETIGAQTSFARTFKTARERAYDAAYEKAYRAAYLREFRQADLSPPSLVQVREQ